MPGSAAVHMELLCWVPYVNGGSSNKMESINYNKFGETYSFGVFISMYQLKDLNPTLGSSLIASSACQNSSPALLAKNGPLKVHRQP